MDGIGRRRSGIGGSIHLKSRPASEERNANIALYAPSLPQVVLLASSCPLAPQKMSGIPSHTLYPSLTRF
jgi:hypothetical protein